MPLLGMGRSALTRRSRPPRSLRCLNAMAFVVNLMVVDEEPVEWTADKRERAWISMLFDMGARPKEDELVDNSREL